MNTNTFNYIKMLNTIRQDTLLKLSDSAANLKEMLFKYYDMEVTDTQAESLFKGVVTMQTKLAATRKASKEVALVS